MKKVLLLVVIAVVVILAITLSKKDDMPQPLTSEENVVVIADQKTDVEENTITVGYAKLSKPGFVVLSTKNSQTGEMMVLGTSTLLSAGEHFNIKVKRTGQIISSGKTEIVAASLVADNGDGEYSDADNALTTETGDEAMIALDIEKDGELSVEEVVGELEDNGYVINEDAAVLVEMSGEEMEAEQEMNDDSSMETEDETEQENSETEDTTMETTESMEL